MQEVKMPLALYKNTFKVQLAKFCTQISKRNTIWPNSNRYSSNLYYDFVR